MSQGEKSTAVVSWIDLAGDQSVRLRPVDKFACGVKSYLEDVRELGERWWPVRRVVSADSEEELMLRRGEAGGASLLLGEALEDPKRVPEACEGSVVAVREWLSGCCF